LDNKNLHPLHSESKFLKKLHLDRGVWESLDEQTAPCASVGSHFWKNLQPEEPVEESGIEEKSAFFAIGELSES